MAMHGEITEKINIYCNDVVYEAIKEVSKYILPDKLMKAIYEICEFVILKDEDKQKINGMEYTFFDINAKKVKQTGFMMWLNESEKFTFIGDETCSETTKKYVENSKWLFADAYMAEKEAEEYNPIQKHHHSTVKFVAELCKELNVKNVIMSHTVDTDLENRKKLFTEDAHKYYGGKVYVPDDLEVIEIK